MRQFIETSEEAQSLREMGERHCLRRYCFTIATNLVLGEWEIDYVNKTITDDPKAYQRSLSPIIELFSTSVGAGSQIFLLSLTLLLSPCNPAQE